MVPVQLFPDIQVFWSCIFLSLIILYSMFISPKEIEGKGDTEIECKVQYFDSELVQGLTNYSYIWRKKIGKW